MQEEKFKSAWSSVVAALEACPDERFLESSVLGVLQRRPHLRDKVLKVLNPPSEQPPCHQPAAAAVAGTAGLSPPPEATPEQEQDVPPEGSGGAPPACGGPCAEGQTVRLAVEEEHPRNFADANELVLHDGAHLPKWFNKDAVIQLRETWSPRPDDVFIATHFPIRGVQRLLVALVEGRRDPWMRGLLDKPHFCDAAACKRGVDRFIQEAAGWNVPRRCFKTMSFPHTFPVRYPFDAGSKGPKILALVADPRQTMVLWWEFLTLVGGCVNLKLTGDVDLQKFIGMAARSEFRMFGDYFQHAAAWSQEATRFPDTVRLVNVDRLGSLNPKEVRMELESIADFLDIPRERAWELTAATFRRPPDAKDALLADSMPSPEAINGGQLIEIMGRNLVKFEDALNSSPLQVQMAWRNRLSSWFDHNDAFLASIARNSARGVASTPPLALTTPLKGEAVHAAGMCRPCVFALRGVCRDPEEMCMYCHAAGHSKTKRASHKTRKDRQQQRMRTPSPDRYSEDNLSQ